MRIVSLLPSATEIICGIGLRDQLVGVSHECDFPADVKALPKVTQSFIPADSTSGEIDALVRERVNSDAALYRLDIERVRQLRPDLIVTQALCDVCAVSESEIRQAVGSLNPRPQTVNLAPECLDDVFDCITKVGEAASCISKANDYIRQLRQRVDAVAGRSRRKERRPSVVVLEWIDPPFCAGHWTPELVRLAGGQEALGVAGKRSVTTPWQAIVDADPECLLIACCGFDIERTLKDVPVLKSFPGWNSMRCVESGQVFVADGSSYFNRPGPRLVDSLEILAHALDSELHPLPAGLRPAKRLAASGCSTG